MSAKAIYEFDGKSLLNYWLPRVGQKGEEVTVSLPYLGDSKFAKLDFDVELVQPTKKSDFSEAEAKKRWELHVWDCFRKAEEQNPWLLTTDSLVVKPDQLIKRRGKAGLLGLKLNWDGVKRWVVERAGKAQKVENVTGILSTFIVEPFVPHAQETEYYICVYAERHYDVILFTHEGGVDIGDVDAKAERITVDPAVGAVKDADVDKLLLKVKDAASRLVLVDFVKRLYQAFVELQFTYLEINPLVVLPPSDISKSAKIYILDMAAKLDQTAEFECSKVWSLARACTQPTPVGATTPNYGPAMTFPAPFGRKLTPEEAYIQELDSKTGASLKLTVLNANGSVWTMVAGGGASVVYSDAIANAGFAHELANYGEYSGAPSEQQTFEYAKTIFGLMTRGNPRPEGKVLFIGGGIANFTNVASTFKGIIRALDEFQHAFVAHKIRIWVRRAGPNYQEGLRMMRQVGENLKLQMFVFGPEMHVTGIVPMALKNEAATKYLAVVANSVSATGLEALSAGSSPALSAASAPSVPPSLNSSPALGPKLTGKTTLPNAFLEQNTLFKKTTRCFVYGMQARAVQGMLDFDHMCGRKEGSVAAMIYPFGGGHVQKFYWGTKETLVPVYQSVDTAVERYPDVDTIVNFASCRSVYESTMKLMEFPQIKTIAIIAEGVPERRARQLLKVAAEKKVLIIGPATVGGIKPGCFKIGNTGGMMDNIVSSKLYRPGSVAYVSKSGGMSNELNNIVSRVTDGVYEGVAIGGDRYPGSTFIDHMLRYERDPGCKILLLLGEVGGVEEYEVSKAVSSGLIKKPVVAWCIGTCAKQFNTEVQFGHAGACANSDLETADAKNSAMKLAGILVPDTFEDLPHLLGSLYKKLVAENVIETFLEPEVPKIPVDYAWAQELGLIRKPASFVSTICDDRGQELLYAGMPISQVFKEDIGIGGVLSLLWFKRRLPDYACKFIESILMLTADHGPAVSGAHNTIVTARAGKDLVSSLVAGLLTIGDRFGGALDGAAQSFSGAFDGGQTPQEFVDSMRKQHKLILGIGHKIKSRTNPDLRVELIKNYVFDHFPSYEILKYALEVEKITTTKKDNLILNVDGAIGCAFVDLLRSCGAFSREEAEKFVKVGCLNGLFVLGRSIGFIGHYIDQVSMGTGLYRHPWDDISYMLPDKDSIMGATSASVEASTRTYADAKTTIAKGTGPAQ